MKTQIFPVIVIYNKQINESLTLHSLLKCKVPTSNICILDNSTSDYRIKEFCDKIGCTYISMNGNMGLSKAYNRALEYLKLIVKLDDLVVWLDDDTKVTQEYFTMLKDAAKDFNYDIFLPVIIGQDGVIYSPNEGHFFGSKFIKSLNEDVDFSRINGINSCLAVRARIYENYSYTEELFMDLTDNKFFDDMRARKANFCILRTPIHQTFFQRGEYLDAVKLIGRLRIKLKDFMVYANSKGKIYLFGGFLKCIGWGINLGIKSKSPKVFSFCIIKGTKELFRNLFK